MSTKPRVSIAKCDSYDAAAVRKAVYEAVASLGGIDRFISKGDKVFLKVNLLMPKAPDEAVTTHPSVVKAVIQLLEEAGAKVVVGDSPAMGFTKQRLEKCYRKSQMYEAIAGTKAELNWNLGTVRVSNPKGKLVKNLEIIEAAASADKIVSLPKLKTHSFTTFTGAVKIHYGLIPGYSKAAYHAKLPDAKDFSEMLLDVALWAEPALVIMDGIIGMEGAGPSGGDPKKAGAVLASADMTALDVVATTLVKMEPMGVPTISNAVARGISTGKIGDVELVGASLEDFAGIKFKWTKAKVSNLPAAAPEFLLRRWTRRPVPDAARCIACGECAKMCPKQCIRIEAKGKAKPIAVMDYKKCIRCYCCHEVCPEKAIDLK
jgi:uncharacterized protein (DUF362 family)/Pyruvate/2-oxoacid:ferredoxin oxidoreductase delta subunit